MEDGIGADSNFYARAASLPQSPEQQHQQRTYDPPSLPDFETASPQSPPKLPSLTTSNLQAVTLNGYVHSLSSGGGDPDDFYRGYRGVEQSSSAYTDLTTNVMTATASESRPTPSNGHDAIPKHPIAPITRTKLKPSYRSASVPFDERTALGSPKSTPVLNAYGQSRQPSVKDLLKRFDQNNGPSSSTARKPASRIIRGDDGTGAPGYMRGRGGYQARPAGTQDAAGVQKTGALTRDATPGRVKSPTVARPTQKTRLATEDQHSNNAPSSIGRSFRPRNPAAVSISKTSKSVTNLSHDLPTPPSQTPVRKPLFGEVLLAIEQEFPQDISYGIPRTATRRTSDSSLHPPRAHQRRRSVDVSPSSPTAWYLGVTPALDDVDTNKPRPSPGHNRNHSDFADNRVNTMNGVIPSAFQILTPPSTSNPPEPLRITSSRLPLPSKRDGSPTDSSSSPSTRATSPFSKRTLSNGKLRRAEQSPRNPAGRVMTPTNSTSTTARLSPRGKKKGPEKLDVNNSSLKAYISAPPPKTSPTLRSSRPRQPVSSASAASSRHKAAECSGSPQQVGTGMKITRNGSVADAKPRKIVDVGPVDFAARRARIQRAYTKSIHETEQKAIRMANLNRLNERHARDYIAAAERAQPEKQPPPVESLPGATSSPSTSLEPLHISTSFPRHDDVEENQSLTNLDSPTLGMPGSFVDDEPPRSAISTATGITDIDNEPQTEAARLSRIPFTQRLVRRMLSSHALPSYGMSPDEASYSMGQGSSPIDGGSIQIIMVGATPIEEQPESTLKNVLFSRDPSPSRAFEQEKDCTTYDQPVFATAIAAASPTETTLEQYRASTPLESGDETPLYVGFLNAQGDGLAKSSHNHEPQEISCPLETEQCNTSDSGYASRLELHTLKRILAPPLAMNDVVQDLLNTPGTDVDYESCDELGATASEQGTYDNSYAPNQDVQTSPRIYRMSEQSVWTGYAVDTADEYFERGQHPPAAVASDSEEKPPQPPKERSPSPKSGEPPQPEGYTPQPSPFMSKETSRHSSPTRHQRPPPIVNNGTGLGFTDVSPQFSSSSIPIWPDYAPPPPPIPQQQDNTSPIYPTRTPPPLSFYNKRPPSSIFQGSQNGTSRNTESRRASDDVYSTRASSSTPRSSTQISLEDVASGQTFEQDSMPETDEERKAAEKLKKRLFQRMMLIKELIDTECVYLKDMNVVEEIYKGTAEACPKLDSNDIKAIFRNTDEIVAFSTIFLDELKSAASSVYSPRSLRSKPSRSTNGASGPDDRLSMAGTLTEETDEQKDRRTFIGANFGKHLKKMQSIYTDFLKNSELANSRLTALQADAAVKVWLSECNHVAKDLTAAWDLDALLVKPVQRITRYQLLLAQILEHTPEDHLDYAALQITCRELAGLLKNIDDLKRRIHMVGKIVGRKRKESEVRSGLAKAFGRRTEKLQISTANRPHDDEIYLKLHEKFGHDYLKLQIILRDFEFYTRQVGTYVVDFLRYLSSIELMVRLSASPYPELESKWARFNMSMRDMGSVALEDHINAVRKRVIEPIEQIIQAYGPPGLAMKKRSKRRLDYEKFLLAKTQGKKIDEKLSELVDQYEALNETLKLELPKLYAGSQKIGNICLVQFVAIQTEWYAIWNDKVRVVLEENQIPKDIVDIVDNFNRDYKYVQARAQELGIVNGTIMDDGTKTRGSLQSMTKDDDASTKSKSRPSNQSSRDRGLSMNSDRPPSLLTPDFPKRYSGQFAFSPIVESTPGIPNVLPQFAYQTQPFSNGGNSRAGSGSPATPDTSFSSRPYASSHARPSTGRSYASDNSAPRISTDYNNQHRRESSSTHNSASHHIDDPLLSVRPFSGLFHSAMPLPDGPEDGQRSSSRASSRDRTTSGSYNVLYLAASLFEFNISVTKTEAGYPYLTYQAGEIFDVIGEKGELWLAKNQDDPSEMVGWIWSKHFARLAND